MKPMRLYIAIYMLYTTASMKFCGKIRLYHTQSRKLCMTASSPTNVISSINNADIMSSDKPSIDHRNADVSRHRFSVAPMMDYTDRYQRYMHRLLSNHAVLYTEMVTASAILQRYKNGTIQRDLEPNDPVEEPVVLQLGGSDPVAMQAAAKIAATIYRYRDMNLNVGCPSERVAGAGCFGASLMLEPLLVADLCNAISDGSGYPASVKCRIGVNDKDSYDELCNFIHIVSNKANHVTHFIIHARKAILDQHFTPDDNRKIPPLRYDVVYKLAHDFPNLRFTLNGGINSIDDAKIHMMRGVHGVMVGRSVVNVPYSWRHVDSELYHTHDPGFSRRDILEKYASYAKIIEEERGPRVRRALLKPLLNIFAGESHTRQFKIRIDELMKDEKGKKIMPIYDIIHTAAFHNGIRDDILDKI